MSTKRKLATIAKVHQMAVKVIADTLREHGPTYAERTARAIVARLAAHDPRLFICTADEMREQS